MDPAAQPLSLGALLTLEELDTNLYRATNPTSRVMPRLFGGQVAAQALAAAAATVEADRLPHSIHGYFLRGGRLDRPTIMAIDRDRDGRSFSARHVNALQDGKVIFSALASFHVAETGLDYQLPPLADDAGDPDTLPDLVNVTYQGILDVRSPDAGEDDEPRFSRFWLRPHGDVPGDPVTRACVLTYVSDVGWAFAKLGEQARGLGGPSLDHAVWLQRPVDINDWMFLDLRPVTAAGARGVFTGTIHSRDGALAAYIAQEALLRPVVR